MAAALELEIVTPRGIVLDTDVDEVVAPSVNGEFGVLPGHLPLLAALGTGLVHYTKSGKTTDVAVGRGFVEVLKDRALVLTDRYATKDDVDVLKVRERLKEVDSELERWEGDLSDPARLELIEEEQWLAAQLELIGDPPPPRVLDVSRAFDYAAVIPDAEAIDGEAPAIADDESDDADG